MAKIATCPKCAKQLGLPASITATDRAECPECHAIFSLSEAVQISLPVARVLDPAEMPVAAASSSTDKLQKNVTEALASNSAPLKSWEERLKNALALDDSTDETTTEKDKTEPAVSPVATPSRAPSFEFELDPSPPTVEQPKQETLNLELPESLPPAVPPEPVAKQASSPAKTLADFAPGALAAAGGALAGLTAKASQVELPKLELPKKVEVVVAIERAAHVEKTASENAAVAVRTVARQRVRRSSLPKIAALATGPVLGGFLGLYGLLWFQGAKADFVGLARVLPASLLPENFGNTNDERANDTGLLAEANSPGIMAKLREPPVIVKRDEAVRPASAAQPVPPVASTVRIKASEFNALVDAATVAVPEFAAGDLSTPESVKRKGQAYMALCRLAEHLDFTQQLDLAPAVQTKAKQALQLYQRTASQTNLQHDLAHIAGRWWEYDKRPNPGIFLTGEVQQAQPEGDGTLCWVKLGGQTTVPAIPVWFKQGHFQTGDLLGVVGSVLVNPDDFPAGFSGGQVVGAEYGFTVQSSR